MSGRLPNGSAARAPPGESLPKCGFWRQVAEKGRRKGGHDVVKQDLALGREHVLALSTQGTRPNTRRMMESGTWAAIWLQTRKRLRIWRGWVEEHEDHAAGLQGLGDFQAQHAAEGDSAHHVAGAGAHVPGHAQGIIR